MAKVQFAERNVRCALNSPFYRNKKMCMSLGDKYLFGNDVKTGLLLEGVRKLFYSGPRVKFSHSLVIFAFISL